MHLDFSFYIDFIKAEDYIDELAQTAKLDLLIQSVIARNIAKLDNAFRYLDNCDITEESFIKHVENALKQKLTPEFIKEKIVYKYSPNVPNTPRNPLLATRGFFNQAFETMLSIFVRQYIDEASERFVQESKVTLNNDEDTQNSKKIVSLLTNPSGKYSLHVIEYIKNRTRGLDPSAPDIKRALFTPFYHRGMQYFVEECLNSLLEILFVLGLYTVDLFYSVYKVMEHLILGVIAIFNDPKECKLEFTNAFNAFINCINILVSIPLHVIYIGLEIVLRTIGTIIPIESMVEDKSCTGIGACFFASKKEISQDDESPSCDMKRVEDDSADETDVESRDLSEITPEESLPKSDSEESSQYDTRPSSP